MRLIDADKLALHLNDYALQEAPFGRNDSKNQKEIYETIKECMKAVEEQPTADRKYMRLIRIRSASTLDSWIRMERRSGRMISLCAMIIRLIL